MFFNESNALLAGSTVTVEATESGLTGDMTGIYRALHESTEEWYNLREKMMRLEHKAIVSEDANLLSEGVNEFFHKIAEWFRKLWARVKEIWNKFVTMINQATQSDKEFVKKYKKVIANRNISGFETKARKWKGELGGALQFGKLLTLSEGYMAKVASTKTGDALRAFREEVEGEEFMSRVHARLLGNDSGTVEGGDFSEKVRASFFEGGDSEMDTRSMNELTSIGDMFATIENAQKNLKDAEKDQKAVEKLLEEAAKFYDGVAKKLEGVSDSEGSAKVDNVQKQAGGREVNLGAGKSGKVDWKPSSDGTGGERVNMKDAASVSASACRRISTVATTAYGMLISAIRERRTDYRAILARMATYSPKSEDTTLAQESASVLDQFA